jgi:hypothetical protein
MSYQPHAVAQDYLDFTGEDLPDGFTEPKLNALLRRASLTVDGYLPRGVVVDSDDLDIAETLRDATCAQAAWWVETADGDPSGAAGVYDSVSILDVTLSKRASSSDGSDDVRISPEAVSILKAAGLLTMIVRHR